MIKRKNEFKIGLMKLFKNMFNNTDTKSIKIRNTGTCDIIRQHIP